MSLAPGPIIFGIYSWLTSRFPEHALGLIASRKELASLLAGFSFAMLGFLAAVITLLFGFMSSRVVHRYRQFGYMDAFFLLYFITIMMLLVTAAFGIASFSFQPAVWPLRLGMMALVNSCVQVAAITLIISNLARRAAEHAGQFGD